MFTTHSRSSSWGSSGRSDGTLSPKSDTDSSSSLDMCGPSAPAALGPGKMAASLDAKMRVFTRDGCPTLGSIVGRPTEVWSGRRWVTITVSEVVPRPQDPPIRVELDDGSCLVCSKTHAWALVSHNEILPVRSADVVPGHFTSPYVPLATDDLGGVSDRKAYMHGYRVGRGVTERGIAKKYRIPESVFRLDRSSLGLFVAGWADSQNGSFFGPHSAVNDLKLLMCRLGVCNTFLNTLGMYTTLIVSEMDASLIPNPNNKIRNYRPTKFDRVPRVAKIREADRGARMCTILSKDDSPGTVVVDGVLTLF